MTKEVEPSIPTVSVAVARELLDMGARLRDSSIAEEQLRGAVAIHNLLATQRVAYLADEVGMGKTYVALGAAALLRHFDPRCRVLVIAPRENIQRKWLKEAEVFARTNVRIADLRAKGFDGRPARQAVSCDGLIDLLDESGFDAERDFFMRLTSFSLKLSGGDAVDPEAAKRIREALERHLPTLPTDLFDRRDREGFKRNVARAMCCVLPPFDLIIVDEGHNLKKGVSPDGSARNAVLAGVFGRDSAGVDRRFVGYGPRARRVLFLSATPIEDDYEQLWRQLDVFGFGGPFAELKSPDASDETKKEIVSRFLIRRVTTVHAGPTRAALTKNLYRREWRRGGVARYDEPLAVRDPRNRLIVALVQKKVSELLGHERFGSRFQIGMLASFESFLETAKLKSDPDSSNFDDEEQFADRVEREGLDVRDLNSLARSHRLRFGSEMPHPKMDALVEVLEKAWESGEKALVFVRRVASVFEIRSKLERRYDEWLRMRLHERLPERVCLELDVHWEAYGREKQQSRARNTVATVHRSRLEQDSSIETDVATDEGGSETFFAWFFRGEGPSGVLSGASLAQRLVQRRHSWCTVFDDNYVADLVGVEPGRVEAGLSLRVALSTDELRTELRLRTLRYLSGAKRHSRGDRFEAVQAAAVECLKDLAVDPSLRERSRCVWELRFRDSLRLLPAADHVAPEPSEFLEVATFFTLLRRHPELRARLWPESSHSEQKLAFRERELRAQLLSAAARLGHSLIELWTLVVGRAGTLGTREDDDGSSLHGDEIATAFVEHLERERLEPRSARAWGAFDELSDLADHFDLILDVNEPAARTRPLSATPALLGTLLGSQRPVGGMAGEVNRTLVRQFRMPGYPLVLITTDVLQEGEDLHTFCSQVHHYGIAWMPSAMEQRIGRIDRVRSAVDRRLRGLDREPAGHELLQVHFPYLEDTVERLQVHRVFDRMNAFLRRMHEGHVGDERGESRINTAREFLRSAPLPEPIREPLVSAFPIRDEHLTGQREGLAVDAADEAALRARFLAISRAPWIGLEVEWEVSSEESVLLGTARLNGRRQAFRLTLRSIGERLILRCATQVGEYAGNLGHVRALLHAMRHRPIRLASLRTRDPHVLKLAAVDDVLLQAPEFDSRRAAQLVTRVVTEADALEQAMFGVDADSVEALRLECSEDEESS